jgi:hypothetical protein
MPPNSNPVHVSCEESAKGDGGREEGGVNNNQRDDIH